MKPNYTCPTCGKPLATGTLEGLCPECMLKMGASADSVPESHVGPTGTVCSPDGDAAPPIPPMAGQEFGRYRILNRLGHGGMGVVYEAEETDSGRRVALKVINQKLTSTADRARFLREGRLAASINHPNSVYVFGTEEIDHTPVIAMEFVAGSTLQQRLLQEGPFPVTRAVDAILQVIDGLEAAQAVGILHRDIKPSNCFEDDRGTVKIGDFGLSISSLPREDIHLTESGAMVGTPAFCSPEQIRGEELNAHSDIYAVGATLFYLLTGKVPFDGRTMPQLIANTLEKRPPSPQQHRRQIPNGLARVILRCLDKQPSERFKSYADLRRALQPYCSVAPTPATIGLRFVAGMVDFLVLGLLGQAALLLIFGNPFAMLDRFADGGLKAFLFVSPWFGFAMAYYSIFEWRWGATPGKALFRLRVTSADRSFPSWGQALLRVMIYLLVPMLPFWIIAGGDPFQFSYQSGLGMLLGFSFYGIIALLFTTARRSNGFAAIQDLVTKTRVVTRAALELRPVLPTTEPQPVDVESNPMVGPYHVLEALGHSGGVEWAMGYDLRLLRRVLIRTVPPGTPPLSNALRHLSRVGRLRWLTGSKERERNWDAFEGVAGVALINLLDQPQPWAQVRFWLRDLAVELEAAAKDQTMPQVLALDRVWITSDGRAKLLDFAAPGTDGHDEQKPAESVPPSPAGNRPEEFLHLVASAALGGQAQPDHPAAQAPVPIPMHARKFLESLPALNGMERISAALKPFLSRPAEVTRLRRIMIVLGCALMPIIMSAGAAIGLPMMEHWRQQNPDLMQLSNVLNIWKVKQMPFMPKDQLPPDKTFGIFIAANYREVITNETVWTSALAKVFVAGPAREFAENSLIEFGSPTEKEIAEAEAALRPMIPQYAPPGAPAQEKPGEINFLNQPGFPAMMLWATLLFYVGLPAIIAALLFRGGLVLLIAGVTYVRRDGRRASRLRLFWRSLICWCPILVAATLGGVAIAAHKSWWWFGLAAILVIAPTAWSLMTPQRGLQDRLAGTWPVPR